MGSWIGRLDSPRPLFQFPFLRWRNFSCSGLIAHTFSRSFSPAASGRNTDSTLTRRFLLPWCSLFAICPWIVSSFPLMSELLPFNVLDRRGTGGGSTRLYFFILTCFKVESKHAESPKPPRTTFPGPHITLFRSSSFHSYNLDYISTCFRDYRFKGSLRNLRGSLSVSPNRTQGATASPSCWIMLLRIPPPPERRLLFHGLRDPCGGSGLFSVSTRQRPPSLPWVAHTG